MCVLTDVTQPGGGGVGKRYDPERGVFIPPAPFPSWVYDYERHQWEAPLRYPSDGGKWMWDEPTMSWVPAPQQKTES